MAFGRRSTVAGTGGTGYGTAPVGGTRAGGRGWGRRRGRTGVTGTAPVAGTRGAGRGWGRRRRGAASTIASNKAIGGPQTKLTDMRAASGRRMSIVGAVVGEKLAHLGADVKLGFYTISHPVHPLRRAAAKERAVNVKAAATERKRQKVARAVDVEMRKRAVVRESRAARLNTAL